MGLSADQTKKLHTAILAGFNGSDLEQLARFELGERLDNLVKTGTLSDVVLNLIDWAEKHGRVEDLIRAVQRSRPANKEIQRLAGSLLTSAAAEPRPAAGTAPLNGPMRARLRAILLDQFPTRNALAMLVDDSLSVNLKTVSDASSLTEVVFELIQWASIDKEKHLKPLLAAAVEQRPGSKELAALQAALLEEIARPRPPVCDLPVWKDAVLVTTDEWLEPYVAPDTIYEVVRERLEAARESILIGMYEFTAPHLTALLVAARARGVQVTLLRGSKGFLRAYEIDVAPPLVEAGGVVIDAPAGRPKGKLFTHYHPKLVVIDRTWTLLQSVNFSTTGVPLNGLGNRGAGVAVKSAELAGFFADMLEKDVRLARQAGPTGAEQEGEQEPYSGPRIPVPRMSRLRVKGGQSARGEGGAAGPPATGTRVLPVLTPDNYMDVVPQVLMAARESIDIEQQYIRVRGPNRAAVLDAVKQARARNPELVVRVIISSFPNARQQLEELLSSTGDWLQPSDVRTLNRRSGMDCMNKLVVVDRQVCLVGSANWSEMGVSTNREASLLVDSADVADYFSRLFQVDWDLCAPTRGARAKPTRTLPAGPRPSRGKGKQ